LDIAGFVKKRFFKNLFPSYFHLHLAGWPTWGHFILFFSPFPSPWSLGRQLFLGFLLPHLSQKKGFFFFFKKGIMKKDTETTTVR